MRVAIPLSFLLVSAAAQDLSVPTSWRKYWNERARNDRVSISQNAIDTMLGSLKAGTGEFTGIHYWQAANAWSAMALHDRAAGTKTNQAKVVNGLKAAFKAQKGNNYDKDGYYIDDSLWWAQAAFYAYKTYGDAELYLYALATWDYASKSVIKSNNISDGKHPTKPFALAKSCHGATMEGGVFWRPTADDPWVNSITTGLYMTLSAYLAESTKEARYKDAAIAAARWIKAHNINAQGIILDSVHSSTCERSPSTWLFTYNSGKFVEGLSVLADVTGDAQWRKLMVTTANAAVKSTAWQGTDGVITEGANTTKNDSGIGFKAIFIRGLLEAFRRNPSNTNLRVLLHSYIYVQFNSLTDLAKNGNSYSANWRGPATNFHAWGQLAALDVLVAAITAND